MAPHAGRIGTNPQTSDNSWMSEFTVNYTDSILYGSINEMVTNS